MILVHIFYQRKSTKPTETLDNYLIISLLAYENSHNNVAEFHKEKVKKYCEEMRNKLFKFAPVRGQRRRADDGRYNVK